MRCLVKFFIGLFVFLAQFWSVLRLGHLAGRVSSGISVVVRRPLIILDVGGVKGWVKE